MTSHTLPADHRWFWRRLHRQQRRTRASGATLLLSVALFLLFLEELWRHPYEWIWSALLGVLTLQLLYAQWRLASLTCPRCGHSWTEGLWRLPHPFSARHPRCRHCGFAESDAP